MCKKATRQKKRVFLWLTTKMPEFIYDFCDRSSMIEVLSRSPAKTGTVIKKLDWQPERAIRV